MSDFYYDQMIRTLTASEAKAKLLSLLDDVAGGEVIEITKHGRPVARLVPANSPHALRGRFTSIAATVADEDDLFTTGVDWNLD